MKNLLHVRASFLQVLLLFEPSDKLPSRNPLIGGMKDIPNTMTYYSYLNVTPIGNENFGECNQTTGSYSGLLGDMTNNLSDVSLTPIPFDSYDINCGSDMSLQYVNEMKTTILSTPESNSNMTQNMKYHIYKMFTVFDFTSSLLCCLTIFMIYLIARIFVIVLSRRRKRNRNLKKFQFGQFLLAAILFQNIPSKLPKTRTHIIFLGIARWFLLVVVIILLSAMNTELVVYVHPKLINDLEDLLATNKTISCDSASTHILPSMNKSDKYHQLYVKMTNQKQEWIYSANKDGLLLKFDQVIIDDNLADFSSHVQHEITRYMICQRYDSDNKPPRYSKLHTSKESFFRQPNIILTHDRLNPAIRNRIHRTTNLMSAAGLFAYDVERAADRIISSTPSLNSPSIECLNSFPWDKPANYVFDIDLKLLSSLFLSCLCMFCCSLLVLTYENIKFVWYLTVDDVISDAQ